MVSDLQSTHIGARIFLTTVSDNTAIVPLTMMLLGEENHDVDIDIPFLLGSIKRFRRG